MGKRRSSFPSGQLFFSFDAPAPAREEASLAGLGKMVAAAVSRILGEDARSSRYQVAAAISELLSEDVTKLMLDGYASEARGEFNISFHRFLALIAATDRFDVLDELVREIGGAVLVGEEILTAQLGHIDRKIAALNAEKKRIAGSAKPIDRERK